MYLKCVNTKDYINNGSNVHRHTFSNVCTTCKFHKWNGKVYSVFFLQTEALLVFWIKGGWNFFRKREISLLLKLSTYISSFFFGRGGREFIIAMIEEIVWGNILYTLSFIWALFLWYVCWFFPLYFFFVAFV